MRPSLLRGLKKSVVFFVTCNLVFGPVAPVFAQSSSSSTTSAPTSKVKSSADTASSVKGKKLDLGSFSMMSSMSGTTKDREDLVGAGFGKVKIDINQGAFTQKVVFDLPPGRNGLTPDLALIYNSQDLSDSPYGYGWQLSVPSIERSSQTGTDRLYVDSFFTSSLGGELVPLDSSGGYGHRFEDGRFIKYQFQNNVWTAYDKSGTRYSFGTTTASRQSATTSPDNAYRWMLEEVRDANDNFISYDYTKDGNQIYLSGITYTGHGSTDGPFTVDLTYETRPDVYTSHKTGFWVNTAKRLTEVKSSVDGQWRRKYTMGYASGVNGSRSLLASVQETGRDEDGNTASLPITSFGYSSSTPTYATGTNPRIWNGARMVADVDGNGLPDKAVFWSNTDNASAHRIIDKNEYPTYTQSNQAVTSEFWSYDNSGLGGANDFPFLERGVRIFDLNGDGRADIVRSYWDSTGLIQSYYQSSAPSTWTATNTPVRMPIFACSNGSENVATGIFGNLNGDGLIDYVATTTNCAGIKGSYLNAGPKSGWIQQSSFAPIASMPLSATDVQVSQLVDINGDGLDDWMQSDSGSTRFYLNTGSNWGSVDTRWTIATTTRQTGGWDRGIRFIDMNGDGLLDYVRAYNMPTYSSKATGVSDIETGTYNYVYLNTGSGFATSSLQAPEYIFNGIVSSNQWTGRVDYNELVDWNGDSLPDSAGKTSTVSAGNTARTDVLTFVGYPTGGRTLVEHKYTSQMAYANPELSFPVLVVTKTTNDDGFGVTGSVNYVYEGGRIYYDPENIKDRRFAGFSKITQIDSLGSSQTYYHQGNTASTTIGELSDGLSLIGKKYREDVLTTASTTIKKAFYRWTTDQFTTNATTSSSTTDIARGSTAFSNAVWTSSVSFNFTVGQDDNILVLVGDSQGGVAVGNASFAGIPLTPFGPTVTADSNRNGNLWYLANPPTGTHTVVVNRGGSYGWLGAHVTSYSGVDTNNPFGAYSAQGAIPNSASTTATVITDVPRSWLVGFFGVNAGGTRSVDLGAFLNLSDLESWDSNSQMGSTGSKSVTYSNTSSGTMLKFITTLNPTRLPESAAPVYWFPRLIAESTQDFETGSTHKDKAIEYSYATSTGNLLQMTEKGEVTGTTDGTYSDTGSDTRTTIYAYSATTTRNLTLPTSKEIKNNSNTSVALTQYYYDSQSLGTALKGNLTKEEKWITGSEYASTTKAYNSYGLLSSETDPRSNTTTYSYDSFNLYPATVTNALSQDTAYVYDYMIGKPKEIEDANGTVRKTVFDPLGRVKEERRTNPSFPLTTELTKEYLYTDTFPASVRARTHISSASTTDMYTYRDGLGRVIQERSQAELADRFSVKSYVYNSAGLLDRESLPYFASTTARTNPTDVSALYTMYTYDASRRPLAIGTNVGTTTYTYTPWQVRITDAKNVPKDIRKDAYGNITTVIEENGEDTYTTSYTHDALGNLTGITDALGNVRSFSYDGLSRRLSATDLHASGDSIYGIWNYAYDIAGNVASTTDPRGQNIVYAYDSLNRRQSEDYVGASGTEVTYSYDSCTNGISRLCTASSTSALIDYDYDIFGNISQEEKTIAGKTYITSHTYDRRGAVASVTLPNSTVTSYVYNGAGAIESVSHAGNPIITDLDYGAHGKPVEKRFGNDVATYYAYNPYALYRLTNMITAYVGPLAYESKSGGVSDTLARLAEYTKEFFAPTVHAEEIGITEEVASSTEESVIVPETVEVPPEPSAPLNQVDDIASTTAPEIIVEPEVPAIIPGEPSIPISVLATSTASSTVLTVKESSRFITQAREGSIRAILEGKSPYRRADVKGEEISKRVKTNRFKRDNYTIEIVSVESIKGGVQAFVRAWDKRGNQIGFGTDGTVDMERFRIFNPPVLVPDERGDIQEEWTKRDSATGEMKTHIRTLREDPQEALLQVIEHNLSVMKNIHGSERIVKGKRGTTVSTFYSSAGQSAPVDGQAAWNSLTDWSTARSSAGNVSCDTCLGGEVGIRAWNSSIENIFRNIFGFDTGAIGNNVISSATLSVTMHSGATGGTNPGDFKVVVDKHTGPASASAIVNGDYNLSNWAGVKQSNTETAINTISTRQYYNFALNSTGLGNINQASTTWFGLRIGLDLSNTDPGYRSYMSYNAETVFADTTGTTEDPKLVVEHTPPAPVFDPFPDVTGTRVQDLRYSYDALGNITYVIDEANTALKRGVGYTYDDLSRLLVASTTATSTTSFREAYAYNEIGNLTQKSPSAQLASPTTYSADVEAGSSQYFQENSGLGITTDGNRSWAGWIKLESLPTSGNLYTAFGGPRGGNSAHVYHQTYLYNNGGTQQIWFTRQSNNFQHYASYNWTPSTGTWYHIAGTYDGTDLKLYLNGSLVAQTTSTQSGVGDAGTGTAVGANWSGGINFDGLIDDVRVWSRSLSSTEVANLYADASAFANGSNLLAWWKFDNNSQDASGNAYHLSSVNGESYSTDVPFTPATSSPRYTYTTSGYTNPHAPASYFDGTATTTYEYDHAGNVTSAIRGTATTTYTWDFMNRLVSATTTATSSTYAYDHTLSRVSETVGSKIFHYPNKYYSAEYTDGTYQTGTSTSYIWAGDTLVAYVERPIASGSPSGTAKTYYVHPDHLDSTSIVTDEEGDTVLEKDYLPYGSTRVETGTTDSNRGFIAQFENEGNDLSYLNARYYEGARGQFLSQDPVFWEVGLTQDGKSVLQNPQVQNSYSYALNNPILLKDSSGRCPVCVPMLIGAGASITGQYLFDVYNNVSTNGWSLSAYYSGLSDGKTYLTRAGQGAAAGASVVLAPLVATGVIGQAVFVGGVSGVSSIGGNAILGEPITAGGTLTDIAINTVLFGAGSYIPGVRGALPKFGSLKFFTGAHTVRNAQELVVDAGANYFGSIINGSSANKGTAKSAGSFGINGNTTITTKNVGSVIKFISQFIK